MTLDQERTKILIGSHGIKHLANKHIMIVGLGGVGGYAAENIVRAGIGSMTIIDHDTINSSNLNRQIIATQQTIGQPKNQVLAKRLLSINPNLRLNSQTLFLQYTNIDALLTTTQPDYVLDCIDSLSCKSELVQRCQKLNIPIISALGAGGRLDVNAVQITTLAKTSICPLARTLRRRIKKLNGSLNYPVIFSNEIPQKGSTHQPLDNEENLSGARSINGTISYLPAIFGIMMAGNVIQQLLDD